VQDAVLPGDVLTRQCDALCFILATFRGTDEDDTKLRRVCLQKLALLGRTADLESVLPLVRKSPTSSDLYHGLETVRSIARRHGVPARGGLPRDPIIRPLLAKRGLTPEERRTVAEAVLTSGTVASVKRHVGGNMNEVYFITFHEKVQNRHGHEVPVRAVFKPERSYLHKAKCFYAREVAAYAFDRDFAKTGMVPPTVEAILDVGNGPAVGSLQWMVPNASPLGADLSRMSVDEARRHADDLNPTHAGFVHTEEYKKQDRILRTLLFVLSDPDKLANNVHRKANLQNIMVDANRKLWMIDNAYSMGAPPVEVDTGILPKRADGEVLEALRGADHESVQGELGEFIGKRDAARVAARVATAVAELERKPRP
jgi:hypothetical protein